MYFMTPRRPSGLPSMEQEKCLEELKIRVPEELKTKLFRLAERNDRALADYVRHVLARHVYGDYEFFIANGEGTNGEQ